MKIIKVIRAIIIITTNLYLIFYIFKALFLDEQQDTNGLFAISLTVCIILCNFYFLFIYQMFEGWKERNIYSEILSTVAVGFPFLFYYITYTYR